MQSLSSNSNIWRWGVALSLAVALLLNYLANALPIGGRNTGQISDSLPTLLTPAAYVFSIWGVIYLGLVAYAVVQALPKQSSNAKLLSIAPWFIASSVFNGVWILAWQYGVLGLSVLFMFGLLGSLIGIYIRLNPQTDGDWWIVRQTFSVYLGWIIVATIVNVSAALVGWAWNGGGVSADVWAVLLIAIALVLGFAFVRLAGDTTISLVLIWALIGIAAKQWGNTTIALSALMAVAALVVVILSRNQISSSIFKKQSQRQGT